MKYIFCGNMFSDIENDIRKMKVPPPVSSHKYQENILKGLLANKQDIYIINIPRVRYYPIYPQILFRKKPFFGLSNIKGIDIGFINLLGLNYLSQQIRLEIELNKIIRKDEKYTLISFNNYFPQNQAMVRIKKKKSNIYLCNILGDLHGIYGVKVANRYDGLLGKIITKIEAKQDQLSAKSDAFGFLTKHMAKALGVENKPFVVIEGMYSGTKKEIINIDSIEKTIFYAGAVEEEYGILHLLRAFSMIPNENYRLKIAGSGGAVSDIKEYAEKDVRISYLGYITPEQVDKYQSEATCLVNPRTSNHKYVKYSFPSKNMECLASGKPYIAHELICNPPEYKDYIQCPQDESDEALAKELIRVCSLSADDRQKIASKAQDFIINEKNPEKQCKNVIDMMNKFVQE